MSPLEIGRPNGSGTDLIITLQRNNTAITVNGPPKISISWQEETQRAYVQIGPHAPLEQCQMYPNEPVLVGEKIRITDGVSCIEHPIILSATESVT